MLHNFEKNREKLKCKDCSLNQAIYKQDIEAFQETNFNFTSVLYYSYDFLYEGIITENTQFGRTIIEKKTFKSYFEYDSVKHDSGFRIFQSNIPMNIYHFNKFQIKFISNNYECCNSMLVLKV